jgi:F-type H+-transporting ATPase subunit epsilon
VDIYKNNTITDRFYVSGGFAEITETYCAVLADAIIRQSELDPTKAAEAVTEAKAAYDSVDMNDRDAYREASDQLISAQAMVASISPQRAEKV